jgi:hypothetical protein
MAEENATKKGDKSKVMNPMPRKGISKPKAWKPSGSTTVRPTS